MGPGPFDCNNYVVLTKIGILLELFIFSNKFFEIKNKMFLFTKIQRIDLDREMDFMLKFTTKKYLFFWNLLLGILGSNMGNNLYIWVIGNGV